jgi:hypothetical protein
MVSGKSYLLAALALLVALSCFACTTRPKGPAVTCDGPTTPPTGVEPCPPGTVSRLPCPLWTCRHCEKADGTRHGPYATWYTKEITIEVIPDKKGRWGHQKKHERGRLMEAGWLKNGVRHGATVRWYENGTRALEATYCNGVLQDPVRRRNEQGVSLDAGSGWLAPPDGGGL